MSRNPKAELDEQEALAEAQADMEAQIEAELDMFDDAIIYGHIPGYSQFGFPAHEWDDYGQWLGPSAGNPVTTEADLGETSQEDWQAFLKKIEEDLA